MNIILQNLIEKLNKLINDNLNSKLGGIMKNFNGYSINNYLSLISNLDLNMNSFICNTIIEIINELDRQYCVSIERKRKYHIKDYKKRSILTIFGEITYYRHYYKSKLDGKSFCYIDRLLGLKKYDYFDPYIKAEVLDYVSEHNYSETANHINSLIGNRVCLNKKDDYMKRQSVRNIIMNSLLSKPKYEPINNVEELYVIADEKWISTQNNNRKKIMQKSVVVFDGFNTNKKRKSLNNKQTFSSYGDEFIYDSIDYIENTYNSNNLKRIYLMGDGANWIDRLKYYYNYNPNIEIIQGLDHFHLKQCLWRIKPSKDVYGALLDYIIKNNKKDFNRLVSEIIDLEPTRIDKICEYKNYIIKHWDVIQNLFKYNMSCPMESQISHTFAAYFTSRPKGYSKNTIPKLINLRLLKKNQHNIKELFINNINSKEIIDLNNEVLDYSIFDTENEYKVTKKYLRRQLAI